MKTLGSTNRVGAHVFAAALQRHGVTKIFGQSIPSAIHLVAPEFGIRQVAYRTENAGAAMADAYARVSRQVAVVTAQNGPAAALLVPGLSEALKASVPVVAIVQDIHRQQTDMNAFQDLDHFELFRACSKWVRRVSHVERIDDYVDMAFTIAASGRPGPAVLMCPVDLLVDPAPSKKHPRCVVLGQYPLDRFAADPSLVDQAARLLCDAECPLVIAGGGIHLSNAYNELASLQEEASLAVATTTMGKGAVSETHPLSLGVVGYFMGQRGMSRHMRDLVTRADTILLVGTRTNQNGTDSWSLFPRDAKYIHIDIDPQEIGRNYEAVRLVGDAALTLTALLKSMLAAGLENRSRRRSEVERAVTDGRRAHEAEAVTFKKSNAMPVRPERLMADMDKVLTPDTIVVSDASYASIWTSNYLRSRRPGMRFLTPRGLAGIGWGLPFALGAKAAAPRSPVLCLTGDGGFAHAWSELETARRLGLNVVVTVLNNKTLGFQLHGEELVFGAHTDACDLGIVDHASIARACGCRGVRIEDPDDYIDALKEALKEDATTVLDVITDPEAYPPITWFDRSAQRTASAAHAV